MMALFTLTLLTLSFLQDAPPEKITASADPIAGEAVTLSLAAGEMPLAGIAVKATYRPNADPSLRNDQEIGVTDAMGRIEWTPEQAGVVQLAWGDTTQAISVRHSGTPPLAVLIAILAGTFLLGGSVVFFVHMLRDGGTAFEEEQPPST